MKVKPEHIVLSKDGRLADYEPPKPPEEESSRLDSVEFEDDDDGDA